MTERTSARTADRSNDREPYPVEEPDASMGDLVSRLTGDLGILVRDHIQLAKEEIKVEVTEAGSGAGLLGGGALAGWIAVLLLSMGLAWGCPLGLTSALVGGSLVLSLISRYREG